MEYLQLENLTPRAMILLALALVAGWFMFKATKHLIFGLFFALAAVVGVGFLMKIVTMDKARAAAQALEDKAGGGLDAANMRAKAIGEQGYSTSAGSGGQTNEAYKKNIGK